jgi:hypothetical protein
VFYDLETVFSPDNDNFAETYSAAYLPIPLSEFAESKINQDNL